MTFSLPQPWPTNPWPTRFRTVRASPPDALAAGLRFVTVNSPSLGGRGELAVHVPAAAESHSSLPLVVLLHGVYGSFWNWSLLGSAHLVLDRLIAAGEVRPMVLAMPSDGLAGEGTGYLTHPDADYEAWIIDDVVTAVAEMVAGVTEHSGLFLGGNSMGGFGAARLGVRHRDRVSGIVLHSAITDLDQLAEFTVDDIGDQAGIDRTDRNLLAVIDDTGGAIPPLLFDCGRSDPLIVANRELHRALDERGIDHGYEEFDGGHDWDAWSRRIEHGLRFVDEVSRAAAPEEVSP
ncbi:MAG: alpha/beta hydrolase [Ilumatobacteraceae bacterium]